MVVRYASIRSPIGSTHGSLPDLVAAEIKTAIRTGRVRAGERLVEGRLALGLGVSRNPVREAIRRLAAEGLVTITARRGAVVAGMSEREVREMIEVRALLEGHNARLAARRHDAKLVRRIRLLLQRGEKAIANGRHDELAALNTRYHAETAAASSNELLREMLERLRERTALLFAPEAPERQAALWADHAAILRAIVDADEAGAAHLAADHVTRAYPGSDSGSGGILAEPQSLPLKR